MSHLRENVNRRSVLKAGALVVAFSLAGAKVLLQYQSDHPPRT
jgi:hypothetical protein